MHAPYESRLKHKADFRVRYRFYSQEEGGRKTIPYQGYRSDFWYGEPDEVPTGVYRIRPEFEDEAGNVIIDNESSVAISGTARMWVVYPPSRESHIEKIQVEIIGYFMEGLRKVAECKVIEILDLAINPRNESI